MTQPATANTQAQAPARRVQKESSVKETLESILVAFILAFVFRAFVVEAFVIPTGSMAPTLLGAHMRFRCDDCGWRFDTNYSAERADAQGEPIIGSQADRTTPYNVRCPNCGYKFPGNNPADPDNDAFRPPVFYGDRILVLKYLYLFQDPQRWDVVVFKSPDRDPGSAEGAKPTYTQNYIKRLIGKPGESIMILDGDIYVGRAGETPAEFEVQSKPRYVQDALWRVIYDNDFRPREIERVEGTPWKQPWTTHDGSGWTLDGTASRSGRIFAFNNAAGGGTLSFDRNANPSNAAFTDFLAYDMDNPGNGGNPVHDLKVGFVYRRESGDGVMRAKLGINGHTFIAALSPTEARLYHKTATEETQIGSAFPLPAKGEPIRVELTNVDYQVTLRINDQVAAVTTPQDYHPDIPALLAEFETRSRPARYPTAEIEAENQVSSVSHLSLWRDIYYINRTNMLQPPFGSPSNIIALGDEEYFVLGDNSLISGDARYWTVPIDLPADRLQVLAGRVPGRFMLGRAFFVYWPAGFRPAPMLPGLAPNFGDMRFIR